MIFLPCKAMTAQKRKAPETPLTPDLTFFAAAFIMIRITKQRTDIPLIPLIFLLIDDADDRRFLESVYLDYHRLMYAQALQITRNAQAAEDAVSDSLVALSKKISVLRGLECNKMRSYVVITVRHAAISLLNRAKRERVDGNVAIEDLAGQGHVDDRLLEQAGVERIRDAIRALPPREKELMLMRYFREMTDEEIAAETGLKPVSVRVHLSRARKNLARLLGGREEKP